MIAFYKRKISLFKKLKTSTSLGITPTFLKLDSWSSGTGFIPIISTKLIYQEKKIVRKKLSFIHTKDLIHFQKMDAIPRLPFYLYVFNKCWIFHGMEYFFPLAKCNYTLITFTIIITETWSSSSQAQLSGNTHSVFSK